MVVTNLTTSVRTTFQNLKKEIIQRRQLCASLLSKTPESYTKEHFLEVLHIKNDINRINNNMYR